jgi:hypothetical protein
MNKFIRDKNISQKIILLDGISGTGKTMFSPLLASYQHVQNPRFEYMIEYLSLSHHFGKITEDAASSLLNLLADTKCYDGIISRDVNFRPSDLSGVLSNGNFWRYFFQLFYNDGEQAHKKIKETRPALLFVTHQLLTCYNTLLHAFGDRLRVVEMVRHPVYLVDHWLTYIDLFGKSERDLSVWIEYEGMTLPWPTTGWEARFNSSNQYDKVIYLLEYLFRPIFKLAEKKDIRGQTLFFVPFEKFVLHPDDCLKELEVFLGLKKSSKIFRHLRKEKVPRKSINEGPKKSIYMRYGVSKEASSMNDAQEYDLRIEKIKGRSSKDAFIALENLSRKYEAQFGKWF